MATTSASGTDPRLRAYTRDPAPEVQAAFARIARDNMRDVPILNPRVPVQAIGFARWQDHWLGALITPWCLNLMLVPGRADTWTSAPDGTRVFLRIGAQTLAFLPGDEPEIGAFLACSLVSPMAGHDANTARDTAQAALRLLREDATRAVPESGTRPDSSRRRALLLGQARPTPQRP